MFIPNPSPAPTRSSPNKYESHKKGEGNNKNRNSYSNGPVAAKTNGTLESKSKRNSYIRQSSSHGNLADEQNMEFLYNTDKGQVKRTKSFWKFGKSDTEDIVEGMAMWKHRDLIQPEEEMRMEEERIKETTLKRNKAKQQQKQPMKKEEQQPLRSSSNSRVKEMQQNITVPIIDDHAKYQLTKSEIDQRIGKTKERFYAAEETNKAVERVSPSKPVVRDSETELGYAEDEDDMTMEDSLEGERMQPQNNRQNSRMKSYEVNHQQLNNKLSSKYYDDMMMMSQEMDDERFYDDESMSQEVVVMKTVKRKEILKQYYQSSGTSDTERSSSDPYDCIVVQDQHLPRSKNNNFNNNTNNRKNNKNKEMTTFRSEFAMNKNNMDSNGGQGTGTILPRTKLMKNDPKDNTLKKGRDMNGTGNKKPQNVDPKAPDNKRNSLSSAKSYGPWYDLWGANGTQNNTLISHK